MAANKDVSLPITGGFMYSEKLHKYDNIGLALDDLKICTYLLLGFDLNLLTHIIKNKLLSFVLNCNTK